MFDSPRSSADEGSDSSEDRGIAYNKLDRKNSPISARTTRPVPPGTPREPRPGPSSQTRPDILDSAKSQKTLSTRFGSKLTRRRNEFSRGWFKFLFSTSCPHRACFAGASFRHPFAVPPNLQEVLSELSSSEMAFVHALDFELEKIETFYLDREKEMSARALVLNEQLLELTYHREVFHVRRIYPIVASLLSSGIGCPGGVTWYRNLSWNSQDLKVT